MAETLYDLLEVSQAASSEAIQSAYARLKSALSIAAIDEEDKIVNKLGVKGIGEVSIVGVAGAVANGGSLMKPHLVRTVRAPNLSILEQSEPEQLEQAMPAGDAQPRVDARETTDSSASPRNTASTAIASRRASHAPRDSAARA